jgi:hypothetical protein
MERPATLSPAIENNNALNIPSLVVLGQPDNWYIETAVSTDWSMASLDT